jgi:hypothetical protein
LDTYFKGFAHFILGIFIATIMLSVVKGRKHVPRKRAQLDIQCSSFTKPVPQTDLWRLLRRWAF